MLQKLCQEGSQGSPLEAQNHLIFEVGGAIWCPDGVPSLLGAKKWSQDVPSWPPDLEIIKKSRQITKNRSKNEVENAELLGIDLLLMLVDFEGQVGPKNLPKSVKKGIEKTMQKRRASERVLERFWNDFGRFWTPKKILE